MRTGGEVVSPPVGLREARASDVEAMAALVDGFAREGLMLPKSPGELLSHLERYVVLVDGGGRVVGCGGLRIYDADLAEIVSLAVDPGWQGTGQGGRIVDHLVERARTLGIRDVFAMTLSPEFFGRMGFRAVPRAWLSQKEQADCSACPRRFGCREAAVLRTLHEVPTQPGEGLPASAEEPRPWTDGPRRIRLPMVSDR